MYSRSLELIDLSLTGVSDTNVVQIAHQSNPTAPKILILIIIKNVFLSLYFLQTIYGCIYFENF